MKRFIWQLHNWFSTIASKHLPKVLLQREKKFYLENYMITWNKISYGYRVFFFNYLSTEFVSIHAIRSLYSYFGFIIPIFPLWYFSRFRYNHVNCCIIVLTYFHFISTITLGRLNYFSSSQLTVMVYSWNGSNNLMKLSGENCMNESEGSLEISTPCAPCSVMFQSWVFKIYIENQKCFI